MGIKRYDLTDVQFHVFQRRSFASWRFAAAA
jgi:hypothetical protein